VGAFPEPSLRRPAGDVAGPHRDAAAACFAAVAVIAVGAALVAVRGEVAQAVVALVLALAVLVAGLIGGGVAGLSAALAATVSFNFFHTEPYLSLRIDKADDVWTTFTLLAIGIVAGVSSDAALRWRRRTSRAATELAALERIVDVLDAGGRREQAVAEASALIGDLLGLDDATFRAGAEAPSGTAVLSDHGSLLGVHDHTFMGDALAIPDSGVAVPVRFRGRSYGFVCGRPAEPAGVALDRRRAAIVVAAVLGAALSVDLGAS
jgi:K+-sensing histidine kinase KdpD